MTAKELQELSIGNLVCYNGKVVKVQRRNNKTNNRVTLGQSHIIGTSAK